MKYFKNDIASFHYNETLLASITNFCLLVKDYPFILDPFRGTDDKVKGIFSSGGFYLYPTVKKTTLFYNQATDCFFKILQPLTLKKKIFFLFSGSTISVHRLSEYLLSKEIKVPQIMAYGVFKRGKKPFFVMKKIEGKSLYDILIGERKFLPSEIYLDVMSEIAKLHSLYYWLGDAHLSHIFVNDSGVSGFIDIDSIRKNRPFRLKNLAKDLAGLNHPKLPIIEDEKIKFDYYMNKLNIKNKEKFLRLLKYYTKRRWKV